MMSEEKQKPFVPPSVLNPESLAYINATIKATVTELFSSMAPVLQSLALTPEKMAELSRLQNLPSPEAAAAKKREIRERKLFAEDEAEAKANEARNQANCAHRYPTGASACALIRNYPDRQPRAICNFCHRLFSPREWRIGAPDENNPRGRAFIADADPQYDTIVRELLAVKG